MKGTGIGGIPPLIGTVPKVLALLAPVLIEHMLGQAQLFLRLRQGLPRPLEVGVDQHRTHPLTLMMLPVLNHYAQHLRDVQCRARRETHVNELLMIVNLCTIAIAPILGSLMKDFS